LKGKRILVTGASSGIGYQIASDFLKQGAYVGAHFRSDKNGVNRLLQASGGGECKAFQADFAQSSDIYRLWEEFFRWQGGIDVLVNNAAEAAVPLPLEDLSEDAWDTTFQVNLKAPFLLSRAALSYMKRQESGRIINISSVGVKFGGGINTVHYSASKAGLEAITRSFAKAGAPFNVLVNTVQAGVTDTPIHSKLGRVDMTERINLIPLRRLARPEEIADTVLFLSSNKSSFISGTIITVAGGE